MPETVKNFGGEYLARSGEVKVISGNWNPSRLIIVKFYSKNKANEWLNSKEYRAIAPLREQAAKTNAVIVEGA